MHELDAWGADIIGLNCSVGPQTILECIEKMAPATRKKLSAQPNAGMPRDVGGRSMYMASPEYMASYARHLVHAGSQPVRAEVSGAVRAQSTSTLTVPKVANRALDELGRFLMQDVRDRAIRT